MKFQPGQSGNKSGRPKIPHDIVELARSHSKQAIITLIDLMEHADDARVKIAASNAILDRAWGKPAQAVTGADTGPIVLRWVNEGES
jgi:Family of unknown function (DUF5681)